ncbi:MAG: cytochrome c [Candidatus Magnetominusculus sp. LBB02]|nr:cytochrome c [Candidatus Magnetominusculus sp. LBB02]
MVKFMNKHRRVVVVGSFIVLFLFTLGLSSKAYTDDGGKNLYENRCMICHGKKGDGKGHQTTLPRLPKFDRLWTIQPRDFTTATFKFRTTPTGCLPTEDDLINIIGNGIPKAYMPSNADLSRSDMLSIINYIKTFSTVWQENPNDSSCAPIAISMPAYTFTAGSAEKGEKLWDKMKCWECHGKEGRGDGSKSKELKDDWGNAILPFDFTSCAAKATFKPQNAYIAYTTGLNGSGMPSYADSLNEEERWNIVSYTLRLMGKL